MIWKTIGIKAAVWVVVWVVLFPVLSYGESGQLETVLAPQEFAKLIESKLEVLHRHKKIREETTASLTEILVSAAVAPVPETAPDVNRFRPKIINVGRSGFKNNLIVPASFEGRSGNQVANAVSLRLFSHFEFIRTSTDTSLKGHVNHLNMSSESDVFRGLAWQSRGAKPGRSSCLKCHSCEPEYRRSEVWLGQEARHIVPETFKTGNSTVTFDNADVDKRFLEVTYWVTPIQRVKGGVVTGHVRSGPLKNPAAASYLEWAWNKNSKWDITTGVHYTRVKGMPAHREWRGKVQWKPVKRMKFGIQGGVLFNGMDQFNLPFSDIGSVLLASEKLSPNDLPSIYDKLRNEKIAYYQISSEYVYEF